MKRACNERLRNELAQLKNSNQGFVTVGKNKRKPTPTSITVECNNRFSPLAEEFPPLPQPVTRTRSTPQATTRPTSQRTSHHKQGLQQKKQVLVVGDSHARGCSSILKELLGNSFEVTGITKPNAKLSDVVNDVTSLTKGFTKDDHVVVIGGTNDIDHHSPSQLTINRGLSKLKCVPANVIVNAVPLRYDDPTQNGHIKFINQFIKHTSGDFVFNTNSEHLLRHLYTKHGLHLTKTGKTRLCQQVCHLITSRRVEPVAAASTNNKLKQSTIESWLNKCNLKSASRSVQQTFLDRWFKRPKK